MATLTIDQVAQLMQDSDNTRIFSILDSTAGSEPLNISNLLLSRASITIQEEIISQRFSEVRPDTTEKVKLLRDSSSMLYYEKNSKDNDQKNAYLLHLIHLTHPDFLYPQITDSLQIIDGMMVAVNCQKYLPTQSEAILRQAMRQRIKPVIVISDMEKDILDLQQDIEMIYQNILTALDQVNIVTASYQQPNMEDLRVSPEKGDVAFISCKHGWGFTLRTFAQIYAKKFRTDPDKLMSKFWGDNFYDPISKRWLSTQRETEPLDRGFVQFIMKPIIKLTRSIMDGDKKQTDKILEILEIKLTEDDRKLTGQNLVKEIFSRWINAADCLLEMAALCLPSPKCAQKYRTSFLYEGSQNDICAQAMRECDPKGPLMIYVSQMVPYSTRGRFLALGRVFSGTVYSGLKVRIMGPNYKQGKTEYLFEKRIQRTVVTSSKQLETIFEVPSGNIVYLVGVDQYLMRNGTISDYEEAHKIRTAHYSVSPVIRVAVEPRIPADLPKLIEGLKRLSKLDLFAQIEHAETGEHFIAGCHDLHLEVCLKSLREEYPNFEVKQSEFLVSYKESISQASEICMAKSANKHNRLYCTAQPLSEDLCKAVEKCKIGTTDNSILRTKRLTEEFGWETEDAINIWAFGPENVGPNILVNMTTGEKLINEIKDSCTAAFQLVSKEGVLCEENLRQFRANIVDVSLHSDAIHRGGGQIIPTARRVFYACQLTAQPRLQEPIYFVEITSTKKALSQVYGCLAQKRGTILEEKSIEAMSLLIKCHLPVVESMGFIRDLTSITSGSAYANITMSHWLEIEANPLDMSSNAFKIISEIRQRKGLREGLPDLAKYLDTL